MTLIVSPLLRYLYRVTFIASPLLSPSLLPLLFYTADYMESFVTATGQITRGGGSSYASSGRAGGKAPADWAASQHYTKTGNSKSAPFINSLTIKPATNVA